MINCKKACKDTFVANLGLPLGPALGNIFVGFYEKKLFSQISKLSTYFRYAEIHLLFFAMKKSRKTFSTN